MSLEPTASSDTHNLISLAECRLRKVGPGGGEQELAVIIGQIHRRISTTVAKANAECLVARKQLVRLDSTALGRKQEFVQQQEEAIKHKRRAAWHQRIEGTQSLRKGCVKTTV